MQKVDADSKGRGKPEETKKNSDGETPCSFQDGVRSAFDVVFIQLDTKENPVNLPVRVLDHIETGENFKSLGKKEKKRKGLWKLVSKIPEEEEILGLARSCASLFNTYHTACFV
ncbi:hypothetical protein OIU74_027769 [Salix koriyanagi]|uniref:Uncharacterized protein n=1 Tax=Salix koriyanagi TaxID=2511006 RepID=A0A9Q0VQ65_9ROSI|nr:hypothetical protein OIU74_027769 [Salix koriyanagi]